MLKYILFTACILFSNSRLQAWFDGELLDHISGECIRQFDFENAEEFLFLLAEQRSSFTPVEQLRYGSRGLEWSIPTHNWKYSFQILAACKETIRTMPIRSGEDSLHLGIFLYRTGELVSEYGIPSRKMEIRELGIRILSHSLRFLHQDSPYAIYALVLSGRLKRLVHDTLGASDDLYYAKHLAGAAISKASMRVHQSLAIYYYKKAQKDYFTWIQARSHLDSARVIADLIEDETPSDLFLQSFYSGNLNSYYYPNPSAEPVPNNPAISRDFFLESDTLAKRFPYPDHHLFLCGRGLGNLFYNEGQYLKAIEFDKKANEAVDPKCYKPEHIASNLTQIGTGYQRIGEFGISLVYQLSALDMLKKSKRDSSEEYLSKFGSINNNLATCIPDSIEKQIQYFEAALKSIKKIPIPSKGDQAYIAQIQTNLGLIYALSEDRLEKSNAIFLEAIKTYQDFSPRAPEIATCYAALAKNLFEVDRKTANKYIKDASSFPFSPNSEVVEIAEAYVETGDAYLKMGAFSNALEFYRRGVWALALDSMALQPGYPKVDDIVERNLGLLAFQGIGTSLLNMGKQKNSTELFAESLGAFQNAIAMSHILRQQQTAQISQVALVNRTRTLYESAIWLALKLHAADPGKNYYPDALDLAEQSRGLVLLAAVSSHDAAASAGVPDSIIFRQRELQINNDRLQRRKSGTTEGEDLEEINAELLAITTERNEIIRHLKINYRNFYEQVYETSTTPYVEIQKDLARRNSGVVEYFYGDSLLFTFALTADTFIVQQERISPEFEAQLDHIQESQVNNMLENWADQYWKDAHSVYGFLLDDLGIELPGNLLIIPDGRLNYLSFDALATEPFTAEFTNSSYHEIPYLVFEKVISYDYSYTIRKRRQPYLFNEAASLLAMAPSFASASLPDLPESEKNIKELGNEYANVSTLVGEEASLSAFRTEAPKHSIIDLATHGKMDPSNSADCKLYFCPDSNDSGLLHLGEIYNMDLDIRMAVLEACESGLGPNARGEGVMSLARGFSYAGCRTIVTSLWNVAEEEITVDIFKRFYHHLSKGTPVDSALTLAKRDYLLAYRASPGQKGDFFKPFYWSEMVVIGDTSPIPIEKNSRRGERLGLMAGIGILSLIAFLIGKRIRRERKNTAG